MEGTLFYNRTGFALKGLLQLPDFLLEIDSRLYNKLKVVYGRKEIDLAENVVQRLSDVFIIGNTLLIQQVITKFGLQEYLQIHSTLLI